VPRLDVRRELPHFAGFGYLAGARIDTVLILMVSEAELEKLVLMLGLGEVDCVGGTLMTLPEARLDKVLGQSTGQAEVTELDPHVAPDEDVARLDVSVHHIGPLEEVKGFEALECDVDYFPLRQELESPQVKHFTEAALEELEHKEDATLGSGARAEEKLVAGAV